MNRQRVVRNAEALFDAGRKGRPKSIGELLQFLDIYQKAFQIAEYMASIGYGVGAAKNSYAAFIKQLEQLRSDYEASGGNLTVIIEANQLVIEWLTKHISNMDRRIGEFVRQGN